MDQDLLQSKLARLGPARTLLYYLGRLPRRAFDFERFRVMCLEESGLIPPQPGVPGVEFRCVPPDRLREEGRDPAWGIAPAEMEAELAKGDLCYGAFVGEVLASYLFVARKRTLLRPDVAVNFDPQWAFSRWAFTRPGFRGFRLHGSLKAHALQDQARGGRRGILSLVSATNFESLRAAGHLGCRSVGTVAVAQVGGHRFLWQRGRRGPDGVTLERVTTSIAAIPS